MSNLIAYVDGSFDGINAKWGFIIVEDNKNIYQDCGIITNPVINEGWQIGGECWSAIQAVQWAKENSKIISVAHDFSGLVLWVGDYFGSPKWKTKKEYTKYYRQFIVQNRQYIKEFIKIKGHSGNLWNDEVDKLVKTAKKITEIDLESPGCQHFAPQNPSPNIYWCPDCGCLKINNHWILHKNK